MRRSDLLFAVALSGTVGLIATPAPGATSIWTNPKLDAVAMLADLAECEDEARLVSPTTNIAVVDNPPQAGEAVYVGPLGVPIAKVMASPFEAALKPKARFDYIKGCMTGRVYGPIELTRSEEADYKSQTTPEAQTAWIKRFYSSPGFDKRLALIFEPRPTTDAAPTSTPRSPP